MAVSSNVLFKSKNHIALTRKDADAFSDTLRTAFPTIRFLLSHYWNAWVDNEATRERLKLSDANKLPPEEARKRLVMRRPGDDPLPYFRSLADAAREGAKAWVEPPGWQPEWSAETNKEGIYTILNQPRLEFEFARSYYRLMRQDRALSEPPDELPSGEILVLCCDRMYGRYTREDKEQQAFLRKVWRILEKLTTAELAWCDHETLEPKGVVQLRNVWVGFDALEWARRDPRHYFRDTGTYYKPVDALPPELRVLPSKPRRKK